VTHGCPVNYKGKEIAIAFNPKYLIDPLNALPNDEVFVELIDELSPGVLKINGPFLIRRDGVGVNQAEVGLFVGAIQADDQVIGQTESSSVVCGLRVQVVVELPADLTRRRQ
jgi:hypothetical protein